MQKHHGSTVFILALIAVLAVGSYYFLNTQFPYVKTEVKGDWTGIAEVEDVFGASAAAPAAATPPAEVSAGGTAGDEYAGSDDYSDYEEQYGAYEEESAAAPASSSYDDNGSGDYGLEDGPYADYAADDGDASDSSSSEPSGSDDYQDYETASNERAAPEPEEDYGPDHGSTVAAGDDYSSDSYESYSDDDDSTGSGSSSQSQAVASTTPAAARQRSHVEAIPKPKGDAPDAADRVYQWWPDSRRVKPSQFTVSYAGQQANSKAVAVLFSRPPNLQSMNQHARILNSDGEPVSGSWTAAGNPRMVHFSGVKRGRYTVVVSEDVTDTNGRPIGITLSGPVYIN